MFIGKKTILNAIERVDLQKNYVWGNDRELIQLAGMHPFPRSGWDIEKWYEGLNINQATRILAIRTLDGMYIGNIELSNIDMRCGNAEIGLIIGEKQERGKGYGKDAIMTVLKFAFDEFGLHRVYARVLEYNNSAISCFKSCGFTEEGRERKSFLSQGKRFDVVIMGILENEFHKTPAGMKKEKK